MENSFYKNRYVTQKIYELIRLIELICVAVCFGLAVKLFLIRLHFITKVILVVVDTMFFFITLVDFVSWCAWKPFGYRSWVVFSVAAYHMFLICGALLLFLNRVTSKALLLVTCGLNFFTGYVYIIDCCLIVVHYVKWLNKRETRIVPIKEYVDKSVSTSELDYHQINYIEYEYLSRRSSPRMRTDIKHRPNVTPTFSYGGTFPVSKDLAPLPTPDPLIVYSPRKRTYSSSESPYQSIDGSGDCNRPYQKTRIKEEIRNTIARDKTYIEKYPVSKLEINKTRSIFTIVRPSAVKSELHFHSKESQSYEGAHVTLEEGESTTSRIGNANNAIKSILSNKKQQSGTMIVSPGKNQNACMPLSMQDCIWHQYYQLPCAKCGKTHYLQQTTVNGTLYTGPVICTCGNSKNSGVQLVPCECCPARQQGMEPHCGGCPCLRSQEKRIYRESNTSFRRNGLQPAEQMRRRCICIEGDICSHCARLLRSDRGECTPYSRQYRPERDDYRPERDESQAWSRLCRLECPPCAMQFKDPDICAPCFRQYRPERDESQFCLKSCPIQINSGGGSCTCPTKTCNVGCECCCALQTATTWTETEDAPNLSNLGIMAVQEMEDKNVQIRRTTQEDNPQTSETRLITASILSRILKGRKCDSECTGIKYSAGKRKKDSSEPTTTESEEQVELTHFSCEPSTDSRHTSDAPAAVNRTSKSSRVSRNNQSDRISRNYNQSDRISRNCNQSDRTSGKSYQSTLSASKPKRLSAGGTLEPETHGCPGMDDRCDNMSCNFDETKEVVRNVVMSQDSIKADKSPLETLHSQRQPPCVYSPKINSSCRDMVAKRGTKENLDPPFIPEEKLKYFIREEKLFCDCITLGQAMKDCKAHAYDHLRYQVPGESHEAPEESGSKHEAQIKDRILHTRMTSEPPNPQSRSNSKEIEAQQISQKSSKMSGNIPVSGKHPAEEERAAVEAYIEQEILHQDLDSALAAEHEHSSISVQQLHEHPVVLIKKPSKISGDVPFERRYVDYFPQKPPQQSQPSKSSEQQQPRTSNGYQKGALEPYLSKQQPEARFWTEEKIDSELGIPEVKVHAEWCIKCCNEAKFKKKGFFSFFRRKRKP